MVPIFQTIIVIIILGNTGAGKSTFVNYLCGCEFEYIDYEELNLQLGGLGGLPTVLAVKSTSKKPEVMKIGHTSQSQTFMPEIAISSEGLTYCDCPGFLDNREVEINIANAVNIKNTLKQAAGIKVIILINYHSLDAERARGLKEMIKIADHLFGSAKNLEKYNKSILLGITKIGFLGTHQKQASLDHLRKRIAKTNIPGIDQKILETLAERLFIYDPLDENNLVYEGALQKLDILRAIFGLTPIQNASALFQTVLTQEDEKALTLLAQQIQKQIQNSLKERKNQKVAALLKSFRSMEVIEHICITNLLTGIQKDISAHCEKIIQDFKLELANKKFDHAQKLAEELYEALKVFKEEIKIDLDDNLKSLLQYAILKQKMKQAKKEIEGFCKAGKFDEAGKSLKQLEQFCPQYIQESRELQDPEKELKDCLLQIATQRSHYETERNEYIKESLERFNLFLDSKLYKATEILENLRPLVELSQIQEMEKLFVSNFAFGAAKWAQYIGNIDAEPLLPPNIAQILGSPCPIWPGKKVRETHLLTLIPQTVNGQPLTLKLLEQLIQKPLKGTATKYGFFDLGNYKYSAAPASHWVLMSRDVIPESRSKSYADQQALVASTAQKAQVPYQVPNLLDATVSIFMEYIQSGTRLYNDSPGTFTRCQEKYNAKRQLVVGGFAPEGLRVDDGGLYDHERNGLGGPFGSCSGRQGCDPREVKILLSAIDRTGRLAYPRRGKVTTHVLLG